MGDLKPCPFCGGEAAIDEFKDGSGGVVCTVCKFQPLTHASYHRLEGKPKAIEWWNRRTPDISIPTARLQEICEAEAEGRLVVLPESGIGDFSDGYHTFNELYHHRAVLFSVICSIHHGIAWKSLKHDTGDMYDKMFIVGINTPDGQATYHYDIDPYWDMFQVKELPNAPKWDGHTPNEAIRRISKLSSAEDALKAGDK